ncbi:MAG: PCMD domain-containing protein [Bacteroidales bacterium]
MTLKGFIYPLMLAGFIFASCIQDEPLNSECDIISVVLSNDNLKSAPILDNDRIVFLAKPTIDLTSLAPEFSLTEGATITPQSGTPLDFTTPQTYIVTSQDKKWSKEYTVQFNLSEIKTRYSFEHYEQKGKYYEFFEQTDGTNEKQYIWASGNKAFIVGQNPASFPTTVEDHGVVGKAAKLVTQSAGVWGAAMKMPIAAGNLFLGSFDNNYALTNPMKATNFGIPFAQKPIRLKGWYKYTPGTTVTNKFNEVISGRSDSLDIYAVFYEPTPDKPFLNGDNVLNDENILAIARLKDRSEKKEFTPFNILFEYKKDKVLDEDKLKDFKYNLTIVFSSSIDGAYFTGATGSTLIVDEVELVCDEE